MKTKNQIARILACQLLTQSVSSCGIVEIEQPEPRIFYAAGETDTPEHKEMFEKTLYLANEETTSSDVMRIDVLADDGVINLASSPAKEEALYSVIEALEETSNSDRSLVSAVSFLVALAEQNPDMPIRAALVTDGTSDEEIIASIAQHAAVLNEHEDLTIIVFGVDPNVRTTFSNAFSPMPSSVTFATSFEELQTKLENFGG